MFLTTSTETREHTGSYYAGTANWQTNYPELQDHINCDVVVVGGGFSGVSTALELSEKGYKVVLLEANRISWGATGRNGGQIIGGIGHNIEQFENRIGKEGVKSIYSMGDECVEIIRERVKKYNIQCDLTWGYCDAAIKPRHIKSLEKWKEFNESRGYAHSLRLVSKEELREKYINSENYLGGLVNENGQGHCHVLNLCIGEARAAQSLGAQLFEQSKVIEIVHGEHPKVITEKGSVTANKVVLCGNAYMGDLVTKLASKVLPSTSCIIATEPLNDDLIDKCMRSNVAVCDPRTALDYFRLSADKRLLFGGLSNYTGLQPSNLEGKMRSKMLDVFPELNNVSIDYGWSGQMGIGLNRMPQLGYLSENIMFVQAYSGHGVAPTHLMGRIISEAIDGNPERFDLFTKVNHWPWPGGKILRRPAMALGMMYYKVLDAL